MKFSNQYLTYNEYRELGGELGRTPFNLSEYDVRKIIDERTQNRLNNLTEYPFEVKICVFKMLEINEKYKSLENQNKVVSSVNTDGYSESYRKLEKNDIEVKFQEMEDTMQKYLFDIIVDGVPVLYLGVNKC